jgi:hypothetical protein
MSGSENVYVEEERRSPDDDDGSTALLASSAESTPAGDLPLDQVFEILRNKRRRIVLKYLRDAGGPVSMSDLAEHVAAKEHDKPVDHLSSKERKRVYVGLYQCHLPKMNGTDVVEFNKPRGIIVRGENAEIFDEYLETPEDSRPWHRYYAGLSVLSVVVLPVAFVLDSMVSVPMLDAALAVTVVAFGSCAMAHVWWTQNGSESETQNGSESENHLQPRADGKTA